MQILHFSKRRTRAALRIALSYYVTNGLSAALGLLLISGGVRLFLGAFAVSVASVGGIVCIPPDQAAPKRGKFWQLLPAALIGLPLFFCVQELHATPIRLGLLLVPATFIAFLGGAWGKRGLPIAVSVMFAMIFSMAVPQKAADAALSSSLYFALGMGCYLIWATLANALLSLTKLMRTQARQFAPLTLDDDGRHAPLIGQLLQQQAALTDQLQAAHDINMLTIGQYLMPSGDHLPVRRYVHPDVFKMFEQEAYAMGFSHAAVGAMVRSSYHADEQAHGAGVI